MNKQQLITRNPGVKLYDLSNSKEMQLMKQNLYDCAKAGREPTFKLIAPFGHNLKFKADFYYFESENTPITEQILEEMGFGYRQPDYYFKCVVYIRIVYYEGILKINNYEKNLTANQLHNLIELLK